MSCELCEFSEEHGYAKPGISWHCSSCHATGHGSSELHCVICHRTFGSETVFTAHQTDSGCRDLLQLKTRDGRRRFKTVERGDKLVWVRSDAYDPKRDSAA